jgi:hypothetical protein
MDDIRYIKGYVGALNRRQWRRWKYIIPLSSMCTDMIMLGLSLNTNKLEHSPHSREIGIFAHRIIHSRTTGFNVPL